MNALRAVACAAALLSIGTQMAQAEEAGTNSAAKLGARYAAFRDRHGDNHFQRALYMDSSEGSDGITGEIYALVDHPFAVAGAALNKPSQWCDILILHLNTKSCRVSADGQGTDLHVDIGKKFDQPLEKAYRVDFAYRVAAETADYLQVKLNAEHGPLGTSDYRIVLEAAPAQDGRTYIHLSYSYSYGLVARLAMQVYLGTIGRNKVGFTELGRLPDGQPEYIGGMRGVVERNTMRYYLAIEAYLVALSAAPQERLEKSLHAWFSAIERYPRQLHEMEEGDYLAMKRKEYSRQRLAQSDAK
jgi:hypothetical protein